MKSDDTKVCLTIAGLDPSGGAGIIADIKTFSAFGCFAASAISSITFQNTQGVFGAEHQSASCVRSQLEPIIDDYKIAALKTGMLPTAEVIDETALVILENRLENIVVDPVVRSTSGFDLISDRALKILVEKLFPVASVVTPNIPEAERISGISINTELDIDRAAEAIRSLGARCVLIKGGHFGDGKMAIDYFYSETERIVFKDPYIDTTSTHGTGCTLAAAITANLALGEDLVDAIRISKSFVNKAIRAAPDIGKGNSPLGIFFER
ncbi:MAG: bifunctional hydroxymethylpyrimidine kinase/phosphomethylpyrimidine kinase [Acidobacteria bacterium]|nr:bifunctional hydroxymethylpyrimidine kinase/phosphomethylpyrimidine kinase [Acidobacteriota bacterium]